MELKLNKPLCFFDIESTGINISKDRIVEISILRINVDNSQYFKTWRINPEMHIPESASIIHGIYDEHVKDKPNFKKIAPEILNMIKGSDLAGYNSNRFDIPLLAEEFLRNDFNFEMDKHRSIDVQIIFHKMEKRTLSAAYKFYCDKDLEGAHSASADTLATYEVLKSQLDRYEDLENNVNFLCEFTKYNKNADLAGLIIYNEDNKEIFNFGKYKGEIISEVLKKDLGYLSWLLNSDFPLYTKKIFTKIKLLNS